MALACISFGNKPLAKSLITLRAPTLPYTLYVSITLYLLAHGLEPRVRLTPRMYLHLVADTGCFMDNDDSNIICVRQGSLTGIAQRGHSQGSLTTLCSPHDGAAGVCS